MPGRRNNITDGTAPKIDRRTLLACSAADGAALAGSLFGTGEPNLTNRLGFHRTAGTGELFFLVDTQEVKIRAGDLVVERNTMHSWRNEGTAPASMLITVVNAGA